MATKPSSKRGTHKGSVVDRGGQLPLYIERIQHWIFDNLKIIGIIAAAVVLGVVIGIIWNNYQKAKMQKTLALEAKAFKLHSTIQAERNSNALDSGKNDDAAKTGHPYQEVLNLYQELIEEYPGSKSASRALYMMGSVEYEIGNYDKAQEYFSTYRQQYPQGAMLTESEKSLGYILAQQGKYQKAIEAFKRVEDKMSSTRKAEIQLAIGRNYEALNNVAEAVTVYQKIVDSNTAFSWKNSARERLDILQPKKEISPPAETSEGSSSASEEEKERTSEGTDDEEAATEPSEEVHENINN